MNFKDKQGKTIKVAFYDNHQFVEKTGIYQDTIFEKGKTIRGNFLITIKETIDSKNIDILNLDNYRVVGIHISKLSKINGDFIRAYIKQNISDIRTRVFKVETEKAHYFISRFIDESGDVSANWQYSATGGRTCEGKEFFEKECRDWFEKGLKNIRASHYTKTKHGVWQFETLITAQPSKGNNFYKIKVEI